ncbi:hypothetical protein FOA52_006107 [Chlamydomonas sp. UWO 241]|nr:hypothetical protein FOA52_006107 [Chlamydomonas sp. UWO 241]
MLAGAAEDTFVAINSCPGSLYRKVPMFNQPLNATYFSNISSWGSAEFITYGQDELIGRSAASISFLVIAAIALEIFIAWRIIRCVCRKCCDACQQNREASTVARGGLIWGFKGLTILCCLGVVATAIAGFAVLDKKVTATVLSVTAFIDHGQNVTLVRVDVLLESIAGLSPIVADLNTFSAGLPAGFGLDAQASGSTLSIDSSMTQLSADFDGSLDVTLNDARQSTVDISVQTEKYENYAYIGAVVLYGLAILMGILVTLFVMLHCPLGIAITIGCALVLGILFFVIALALALGLIGGSDMCENMESIGGYVAGEEYVPLIEYYANATEPSTSLSAVLAAAAAINVTAVRAQILDSLYGSSDSLRTLSTDVNLPAADKTTLLGIITDLEAQALAINVSLGNSTDASFGVLGSVGYDAVSPLYVAFKSSACCELMDELAQMWMCLTVAGWLLIAATVAAMLVLSRLDLLPSTSDCCAAGCFFSKNGGGRIEDEEQALRDREAMKLAYPVQDPNQMPPQFMPPMMPPPVSNQVVHNHHYAPPPPEETTRALEEQPTSKSGESVSRKSGAWKEELNTILAKNEPGVIPEISVPSITVASADLRQRLAQLEALAETLARGEGSRAGVHGHGDTHGAHAGLAKQQDQHAGQQQQQQQQQKQKQQKQQGSSPLPHHHHAAASPPQLHPVAHPQRSLPPASLGRGGGSPVPMGATRVVMHEIVTPSEVDAHGVCFGGQVLKWIDLCAGMSAKSLARRQCVTASVDSVHFLRPCRLGMVVIIAAMVNRTFNSSMEVGVRVEAEDMRTGARWHSCSAYLTGREHEEHVRIYADAEERRTERLRERAAAAADPDAAADAARARLRPITHRDGCFPTLPLSLEAAVSASALYRPGSARVSVAPELTTGYMTQLIMPQHANTMQITFGGQVMAWMEQCAYISASRMRGPHSLTASMDRVVFGRPTRVGDILYITSQVTAIFGSSMEVMVSIHGENPMEGTLFHCADAFVTVVTVSPEPDAPRPTAGGAGSPVGDASPSGSAPAHRASGSGAGAGALRLTPVTLPFVLVPESDTEALRYEGALKRRQQRLHNRGRLHTHCLGDRRVE